MKKFLSLMLTLSLLASPSISCEITGGDGASSSYSSVSLDSSVSSQSPSESLSSIHSSSESSTDSSIQSSSTVVGETRTITYKMRLHDHSIIDVMNKFWKLDGNYPTSYVVGTGAIVDNLNERVNVGNYYIEFLGWYLDEACKIPFDGVIDAENEENITLYAKTKNVPFSTSEDSSGWVTEQ